MLEATHSLGAPESVSPSGQHQDEAPHQPKDKDLQEIKEITALTPSANSTKDHLVPASSFRNVSACHRCRLRKHRCDPSLPRCQPCERAQVKCVGYDPITKQELPRSYVYFLETRLKYLDTLLQHHDIEVKPVSAFDGSDSNSESTTREKTVPSSSCDQPGQNDTQGNQRSEEALIPKNELTPSSVLKNFPAFHSDSKCEGSSTNIIMNLLSGSSTRRKILKGGRNGENGIRSSIHSSFFGLFAGKTNQGRTELPLRREANILVNRYFEFVNIFTPALHRDDVDNIIDHVYSNQGNERQPRDMYVLHIVLAIGAAIKCDPAQQKDWSQEAKQLQRTSIGKRRKVSSTSETSEAYEASAMIYLESYLALSPSSSLSSSLEELQALVLLCSLALLRPTAVSLANLANTAMRSATDLRLYSDCSITATLRNEFPSCDLTKRKVVTRIQDLCRRLWWCAYSLDRLIAPCLGRPLTIPDEVVTTTLPNVDDDHSLTKVGFIRPSRSSATSKYATNHHLRLRRLQSEIHCKLQSQHALRDSTNRSVDSSQNPGTLSSQSNPFISWRRDMIDRMDEWRWSIPYSSVSGRSSCDLLLELGYWQTIITLYRQNITIPSQLVGASITREPISEQMMGQTPEGIEVVYSRMDEACQQVIQIYRTLQSMDLINVAYFAEDQIFITGCLFLFIIWNSEHIRRRLMSDQSPTARVSRFVFQQMSATTIQYFLSTNDTDHNSVPPLYGNPEILTPEDTAQDTPSPFTSDLIEYWRPQSSSSDFPEHITPSLDLKASGENKQSHKDLFECPSRLPFSFDSPNLLLQFATGVQDTEGFPRMPFGSNGLERDFLSATNDLDSSSDNLKGQNSPVPDAILSIHDHGYPGVSMETNSIEDVFYIEVETVLDQAPTIELNKRYQIYNRKRKLWLRAFSIFVKDETVTMLAAGPKSQATFFEFRDKAREGQIWNGDNSSLVVYGPDGRQKGTIAYALQGDATSIGAMPYSVENEKFIRFTKLSIADQRNVPT
ncbi:hypothetical protein N7451_005891 [Penicillium sp. IBT 35674x]|nr:hypothetical protein N7451_005891 [Penicillium sp. IBT 35674x]